MTRITAPSSPFDEFGAVTHAHTRYFSADGDQVPGATTVLGETLGARHLVHWANRAGLAGVDSAKFTDEAAATGSLVHLLIQAELTGQEVTIRDFTPAQAERAQHALGRFKVWRSQHELVPLLVEQSLVCDEHRFGGTVDLYAELDGVPALVDYKTSGGVRLGHVIQVGAYWHLLRQHGHEVKGVRILRLGRSESDHLEEHVLTGRQVLAAWSAFQHTLAIHRLADDLGARAA